MSNVVHVAFPTRSSREAGALIPLVKGFATARRAQTDVMWLKENGELLNIFESTGQKMPEESLAHYEVFYSELGQRLAFFPQYYRFILSIALDLEALGMRGNLAERMCDWVIDQDLVGGETSDIQRLEASRLLARRGRSASGCGAALEERLREFISSPERFALPNKKAAYELTHITFYLSEYGRKDPCVSKSAFKSLENVGIWAFLDGNVDLLAEICIAMRYAGLNPSGIWETWVAQQIGGSLMSFCNQLTSNDRYHAVFMAAWLGALKGEEGLRSLTPKGDGAVPVLTIPQPTDGVLRHLSQQLFQLGEGRQAQWSQMRGQLAGDLTPEARQKLTLAERATDGFERFFESFARTARMGSA